MMRPWLMVLAIASSLVGNSISRIQAGETDAYLPADTDAVMLLNLKQLGETEAIRHQTDALLKDILKTSKQAEAAMTASGFDPTRDLDHVTIAMNLANTAAPKVFALFEGKFTAEKVTSAMDAYAAKEPKKVTSIKIGTQNAYQVIGNNPAEPIYAAILGDGKIAISTTQAPITNAYSVAKNGGKSVLRKELTALLTTVPTKSAIHVVAWTQGKFNNINVPNEQLKKRLMGVRNLTLNIQAEKDMKLEMRAEAEDNDAAQQLTDIVNGLVALYKISLGTLVQQQPELVPVLDLLKTMRGVPQGKNIVLQGTVPAASFEKLLDKK